MDWNNVNLNNIHERKQNFLDKYGFEDLLLELSCNIRKDCINRITVKDQFTETLNQKVEEAKEIIFANLDHIVEYARKQRE